MQISLQEREGMDLLSGSLSLELPHVLAYELSAVDEARLAQYFTVWRLTAEEGVLSVSNADANGGSRFVNHGIIFVAYRHSSMEADPKSDLHAWCLEKAITSPIVDLGSVTIEVLRTLAAQISDSSRQMASYVRQLASLREVHEELQNSYDELRTFVFDEGLLVPKVGFCNEPDHERAVLSGVMVVQQVLPIELRRLTGISLYNSADVLPGANGAIKVDLFTPSDDRIEYSWSQDISGLKKGWLTFAFDKRKGSFLRRNAAIRITFDSSHHDGPTLAFGVLKVRPNKAAVADGKIQETALALRAWVSLSGAPLTIASQMWPTVREDRIPVGRLELTLDGDLDVQDVLHMADHLNFRPIVWDKNRRWIFVHPLGHSPTIARLQDVCPRGTRRIVAEVETIHEEAAAVEYGIAVGSADDDQIVLPETWTRLPPKVSSEIQLELDRPLGRAHSLLLFTRIAEGTVPDNCWAHFKRVYFEGAF